MDARLAPSMVFSANDTARASEPETEPLEADTDTAAASTFDVISADRAAEIILAKARRGTKTAYVPGRWRLVMWVIRSIPSFLFKRLKV